MFFQDKAFPSLAPYYAPHVHRKCGWGLGHMCEYVMTSRDDMCEEIYSRVLILHRI